MNSTTLGAYCGVGTTTYRSQDVCPSSALACDPAQHQGGVQRDSGREARDRLVMAHLALVARYARGFLGRGLDVDDLIAEGSLGLMRAAEKFDPRFGVPFSSYAPYWIKATIRAALMNTARTIRIPAHAHRLVGVWRKAESMLHAAWGRTPSFEDVASTLHLSQRQQSTVAHALAVSQRENQSHDVCDISDRRAECRDLVCCNDQRAGVRRLLERLEPRERAVLAMRHGLDGEPRTLKAVGQHFGVSSERIRQIELRAVRKLKADGGARENK